MIASARNSYAPQLLRVNKDSFNERLIIKGNEALDLSIYDRWGKLAYVARNYKNDWYPSELEEGIYFYQLSRQGLPLFSGWIHVWHENN